MKLIVAVPKEIKGTKVPIALAPEVLSVARRIRIPEDPIQLRTGAQCGEGGLSSQFGLISLDPRWCNTAPATNFYRYRPGMSRFIDTTIVPVIELIASYPLTIKK